MNRSFDSTGIAFDVDLWKDILRVLKPGGHVAAFAASRTYHRLACAIEDAGFEIRDQIDWVYASGMPHGSDATLMIDRERREDVEPTRSETAKPFKGWYSQLKPAHEPICLARKPLDGNLAHNPARTRDRRTAYRRMPRPIPQHGGRGGVEGQEPAWTVRLRAERQPCIWCGQSGSHRLHGCRPFHAEHAVRPVHGQGTRPTVRRHRQSKRQTASKHETR